ncbi:MAG: SGNH/GDSL hydrolase family protein [Clostridia bacterium]|nr:SGNH/GDSL hydrolase family protein [Clostridia bacterium]
MKFDLNMFKSCASGCARIAEDKEGFSFFRFSEAQEKYYEGSGHYIKTFSTAGIRLEFKTDSKNLSMSVNVKPGSSRSFFAFDIFKDGNKLASLTNIPYEGITFKEDGLMPGNTKLPLGHFEEIFEIGEGEKVIKIYFPWSVTPIVRSIEIDDGASFRSIVPERKMLIFGDSITHGYDAFYPSNSYASILADELSADARNKAIGGERFCPGLAKCKDDFDPEIITVAYGTNDWNGLEREIFEEKCEGFFAELSKNYPKAKIFAITPIWRRDWEQEKPCGELQSVREFITGMGNKYPNVVPISGEGFVPENSKYFSDFRLHPNDDGFAFYAKALINEIKKHI